MKKWLLFAALAAFAWGFFHKPEAGWKGLPAERDPQQDTQQLPAPINYGDYTVTPLARYALKAVVLSRSRYRNDASAEIAPLDLALGWGSMSSASVINELTISQSGRWYEYSWGSQGSPLEPDDIARHSANTHCLPATPELRSRLLAVRRHDLVALSGYLVAVSGPDGFTWRSSLSRDDTGGGACEVMWITALESAPLK
ncbi:hypothetical protein IMCC26134_11780 [Verrucomicrobia bacterium IMCC26134]|nr:hypothetical protein IMCC26134_11780 [Verrucomicrobia bacterium IMCC26134]